MVADELEARRWFRQRLDALGAQYPELKTPEAQERLAVELARQVSEGKEMVEGVRRGRPKGTKTAVVELETLSFKVPVEFKTRLQAYAKERRHSISELIREGVEWRIGEGDPLNIRYGTVTSGETAHEGNTGNTEKVEMGVESLHVLLSALVVEVRQLHTSVQAIEQRLGETGRMHAPSVTGNTDLVSADGDIPAASMRAQMGETGRVQAPSVTGNTDTTADGDMSEASMKAQSTSGRTPAGEDTREGIPPYDSAKRVLGKLCKRGHEWGHTGQSLLSKRNNGCLKCEAEKKRERGKAKKEAQPVIG